MKDRHRILLKNQLYFNPFSANVPLLHPLKTSENLWFSDVFRGCRSRTSVENGLIKCAGRKSFHLLHKTKCCWQLCRYAVIQLNDIFAKRNAKVWIEKFSVSLDFIYTTSYKGQFVIIYFPSDTFLTYDTLELQSWS